MTSYAWPGYVSDVVALSGRVEASWGNAIRDRSNQVFVNAAARDAAIPTPQVGQICVITSGSGAGVYQYSGTTVGWTPPWNGAWGYVTDASITSSSSSFTNTPVAITGLSVSFTAIANRRYKVSFYGKLQTDNAGDTVQAQITDGSGTRVADGTVACPVVSVGYSTAPFTIESYSAGSVTRQIRGVRLGFGGNCIVTASTLFPARILVEDDGPNGAPS